MQTSLLLLLGSNFHRLNSSLQEQIYREFYHFLYSPIRYMVGDHATTEDIIHDTFLMTLRKSPTVESEEHLRAWIKVVSRNLTFSYMRKHKKIAKDVVLDDELAHTYSLGSIAATSVEKEVEVRSLEATVREHMKGLKPDQRTVIELKWKKGLSYKEIATEIDDTENAVRRKLHRARVYLKKKLRMDWGERHE